MPKVQTLTEWTDVLHLSTKWDFGAIRSTAIETILPLASPVDKIAISRAYDIGAWIDDAFVDILGREDDLTLAEAQRIPLEDVVAIAQGRRMARVTASVKPRAELRNITAKITGRDSDQIQPVVDKDTRPSDAQSKTADEPVVSISTIDAGAERRIKRWLETYSSTSKSSDKDAVVLCISTFLKKHPAHMVLFLELALLRGRTFFDQSSWSAGSSRFSNYSNDGWTLELLLAIISHDCNMDILPSLTTVCLCLVNQWNNVIPNSLHETRSLGALSLDNTAAWLKYFN
jgi:hypothetical protein